MQGKAWLILYSLQCLLNEAKNFDCYKALQPTCSTTEIRWTKSQNKTCARIAWSHAAIRQVWFSKLVSYQKHLQVRGRSLKHFCLKRKGDLPNQSYSKRMFRTYTSARSGLVFIHSWELDVSQMQDWEPEAWLLETIPMMALAHFLTVAGLVLVVLMQSSQPQPTEQKKITSFITMTRYASKQSQQGRYSDEG